ncbi:hypothetical protein AA0114_g12622 [Alternaria tenuissima]|uniref:Uncharacterized protein n=1 Tax=Alternaria tenuissima TaxID=119927 RepID=A0A4V1WKZ3_9PLEO|nr:hypothetical protein AA0114_g12622 [Alternaria tenuissima]
MTDASKTNSVTDQVLYRTPFRYLYIPGLYIALLGLFTLGHALHTAFTHTDPGGYYRFLIWLVLVSGFFLTLAGTNLCLAWHVFKDEKIPDLRGKHIVMTDSEKRTNEVLRSVARFVPWRFAHILGVSFIVLGIFVPYHTFSLHRGRPDATDWDTMLQIHFRTLEGVALQLAGFIVCMRWYVFRSVQLECTEGTQQD